jgi:Glycosyltransferase family 87
VGTAFSTRARLAGRLILLVWSPIAVLAVLAVSTREHSLAADFVHEYKPAAHAVLAGESPYPANLVATLQTKFGFVYPPLTAFLAAPIALLPGILSAWAASLLMVALVAVTLLALGVSDWRCYAIVFLWFPTLSGIETANLSIPLACAVALCWRWRRQPILGGAVAGILIASKLLLWPLVIWAAAVRRYRFAAYALAVGAAAVIVPWAAIDFRGAIGYPHLLRGLAAYEGPRSHSLASLLVSLTGNWAEAEAIAFAVGGSVLVGAVVLGRTGRQRASFIVAIVASLLLTSVVWVHYLTLLAVVIGLANRRFGVAWTVPLGLWLWPFLPASAIGSNDKAAFWQTTLLLTVTVATVGAALCRNRLVIPSRRALRSSAAPRAVGKRVLRNVT